MGGYGIGLFLSVISVILFLMCSIALSSSPAVCGFSSFWLTIFGKRSFTDLHGIAIPFTCALLSNTGQYNVQHQPQ